MKSQLTIKLFVLVVLGLGFLIPQLIIGAVGGERRRYRDDAVANIASSNAGEQRVAGPILVLPYRVRFLTRERDATSGRTVERERFADEQLVLLPESLNVRVKLELETRSRGIYSTRLFRTRANLSGQFVLPDAPRPEGGQIVSWGKAQLLVGVSDPRGMREVPRTQWNGIARACEPGTMGSRLGQGFHAGLDSIALGATPRAGSFAITVPLVGTQAFRMAPVGRSTDVVMESAWPHPSFDGRFLPDERTVSSRGFRAHWRLSRFATGIEDLAAGTMVLKPSSAAAGSASSETRSLDQALFGVQFLDPVDSYRLTDRALKYGLLFVLLTFVAFFMLEVLRGLSVHPVQYTLVGVALTLFFLLLLSLSEHLPYVGAYLLASGACVALITAYVRHVLGGWAQAVAFGSGLAVLYALLYVVMLSQDYALLLGAVLLFAVLGFVMISTRRVDWSRVGEGKPS